MSKLNNQKIVSNKQLKIDKILQVATTVSKKMFSLTFETSIYMWRTGKTPSQQQLGCIL